MSTVAEQLRKAREARNLSIHQVADATKIRTDHIRALEEGNYNVFSAPVYIRGFVRNYAGILKLDVPAIMRALDEELGGNEKFREPPPLSEPPASVMDFLLRQLGKINWRISSLVLGALALLTLVLLIVTLVRRHQAADPLAKLPPAQYQAPPSSETLPLPGAPTRPR